MQIATISVDLIRKVRSGEAKSIHSGQRIYHAMSRIPGARDVLLNSGVCKEWQAYMVAPEMRKPCASAAFFIALENAIYELGIKT